MLWQIRAKKKKKEFWQILIDTYQHISKGRVNPCETFDFGTVQNWETSANPRWGKTWEKPGKRGQNLVDLRRLIFKETLAFAINIGDLKNLKHFTTTTVN